MKTKKIILTVALFTIVAFAKAQEKYQFMSIVYHFNEDVQISIDGNEFLREEVELKKKEKYYSNTNPLLLKVKEYQDKGWEVMSFNPYVLPIAGTGGALLHAAYLRKKK